MKKYIFLFFSIAMLSGCAGWGPNNRGFLEPIVVSPSFSSTYFLSCLSDMPTLQPEEFNAQFESAEADLKHGRELDKLRFICLSLNKKADYKQFKHGTMVMEQYFEDHPDSGKELQGFQILVHRLEEEMMSRWSAWKSLLNDKKALKAEVESLRITIEEQQKQIEQLKNIENIIKSRETD